MTQDNIATNGDTAEPKIAIVVSRFNTEVTSGLLKGALAYLGEQGISVRQGDIKEAPGAFEIPIIAQALVQHGSFDGVICLGCVVKGETAHFEYISDAASKGLMNVSLETGKPLTFGILTTYSQDQAIARSVDDAHNKGREAAAACVETITTIRQISAQ